MMIDRDTLRRLWPKAPRALVNAVADNSAAVFGAYGLTTPLRVAHFMAQISHESDGGTITEENMNYRTAARIAAVWPSRFTPESARGYVGDPQGLANKVYNGRMGNRDGTMDGYNYRGRGLLQLTGRDSYAEVGELVGLDLINNPQLVNQPNTALTIAACEFRKLNCLPAADKDDIRTVTKRVNGGYIGIDSRRAWLQKWKLAIPDLPGTLPDSPQGIAELEDTHLPRQADGDPASKTMFKSQEGWAAILAAITAAMTQIGQFFETLKPLLRDPRVAVPLGLAGIAAGVFIWYRRSKRLNEDHV